DIRFLLVRYTGTATSIGLAFDNFSPTTLPPPPTVTLAPSTEVPCQGSTVELSPSITEGLAGFLYQWQVSGDSVAFEDMPGEFRATLQAPAIPGQHYRVVVTDAIQRVAISNAVTTMSRPVIWSLSVEDAPDSDTYTLLSDQIIPAITGRSAVQYYQYNDVDQSFLGDFPTTTVDRAHVLLVSTTDGLAIACILDSQETNGGGRAEMRIQTDPDPATFLVRDDPDDPRGGNNTRNLRLAMPWSDGFTDGWVIGPFDESWIADVRFNNAYSGTPDLDGLTSAAFYSGDGTVFDLPLELDRRYRIEARCACSADLNADTILDIFDIVAYLGLFDAGDPAADWNGDTTLDIFDVLAYLADFDAAC
ncbi:MAG: hypothetical protein KDA28_03870, partial [Phycisphaerales bacterium]|nr:hypothetical protein [Phycisphaerales bacterium]